MAYTGSTSTTTRSDGASKPDHGDLFIPGGESAPQGLAPQPLDHFKRGYKERAELRDREMGHLQQDFDRPPIRDRYPSGSREERADARFDANRGRRDTSSTSSNNNYYQNPDFSKKRHYSPDAVQVENPTKRHSMKHSSRQNEGPTSRGGSSRGGYGGNNRNYYEDDKDRDRYNQRDRYYGGNNNNNNYHSSMSLVGFEVSDLVDRLCNPNTISIGKELELARQNYPASFDTGKAITAILSALARRKEMNVALAVWSWMDEADIKRNVFHYNALISVCEKSKNYHFCMKLLSQMEHENCKKNEVTFSSAISTCEKTGQWQRAIDLLHQMKKEGIPQTAIAYNAAISACEKALMPSKAIGIFEQMKRSGVTPTVVTYSALISACEKGQQWRLALQVLDEMKAAGHGANVIAYSAAISALSKGQQWEKALELFRDIEKNGGRPSVVTYNATMTALEKSLEWEKALDLFDEMKFKNMPVTVVSYGSAISACEKGYQWKQCLMFLDEMAERGIPKNVIIFGAAMSCMEKSCRADIAFQLMERMKVEGVTPNVHIYNSAISACARCNLWKEGLRLFEEMDTVDVSKDVVTYNAVLDAVSCNVPLARKLFQEGVERGFYARVSRLGTQWLELDLHFLSLGGGEIALGWWFEVCLVPYLGNSSKLAAVKSIDIVTGYGKTRMRGARQGGDGMRKRILSMLRFMNIREVDQPNKGRIHIDKEALQAEVEKNGGKIVFDEEGYKKWKHEETTANQIPTVPQVVRNRNGAPRRDEDLGVGEQLHRSGRESAESFAPSQRRHECDNSTTNHSGYQGRFASSDGNYRDGDSFTRRGSAREPDAISSPRDAPAARIHSSSHQREASQDEKAYSDGEINPITRSSNKPTPQDYLPSSRGGRHDYERGENCPRAPSNIVGNYNRSRSRSPPLYKKHDRHDVGASRRDEGNSSRTRYGNANNRSHYGGKGGDRDNTTHWQGRSRSFEGAEQQGRYEDNIGSSSRNHHRRDFNNTGGSAERTRGYSPRNGSAGKRDAYGSGSFGRNDRRGYDV